MTPPKTANQLKAERKKDPDLKLRWWEVVASIYLYAPMMLGFLTSMAVLPFVVGWLAGWKAIENLGDFLEKRSDAREHGPDKRRR